MRHRRSAVCIDDCGLRDSLALHHVYPVEPDAEAERAGLVRIICEDGAVLVVEARRFLFATRPRRAKNEEQKGNRIMAAALESEARLQESGAPGRIGLRYGAVLRDIVAATPRNWSHGVSFALTFWEQWVQAARGRWRVHRTVKRAEWPRFARAVARGVLRGAVDRDPEVVELLDRFDPHYRGPRPAWLRGVYGPTRLGTSAPYARRTRGYLPSRPRSPTCG
jgi:hypothetical protein